MRIQRRTSDLFGKTRVLLSQAPFDLIEDVLFVIGERHQNRPRGRADASIIGRGSRTLQVRSPAAPIQERRGTRSSAAEPALDPIDRSFDVAPALAAKERQLFGSRTDETRALHA